MQLPAGPTATGHQELQIPRVLPGVRIQIIEVPLPRASELAVGQEKSFPLFPVRDT